MNMVVDECDKGKVYMNKNSEIKPKKNARIS